MQAPDTPSACCGVTHLWMIGPDDYESFFRKIRENDWKNFVSGLELEMEN